MLRMVALGVWLILVTAAATLASAYLGRSGSEAATETEDLGVEQLTTELTSVPIIRGGEVEGYVILQLSFAADRALLDPKKLDPLPYIKDSSFRVIFTRSETDFRHLKPGDLDRLSAAIVEEANRRLGIRLVREVLFQQLNFVKKEEIRTNWIGGSGGGN